MSNAMIQYLILVFALSQTVALLYLWFKKRRQARASDELQKPSPEKLALTRKQLYREIERHEETEIRLQEAQTYLQCLIDSMPSVLVGIAPDGTITHWNKSAENATGFTLNETFGLPVEQVYPDLPVSMKMIHHTISTGEPQYFKNIQSGKGSNATFMDLTIYPLRISETVEDAVVLANDVTKRVRIENEIMQSDKMLSLGEMAAGLAHELNNPLAGILHNVRNIIRRTSGNHELNQETAADLGINLDDVRAYLQKRNVFSFLENIQIGGERASQIVANMLNFARTSSVTLVETDLRDVIEHSLELANNTLNLKSSLGFDLPLIYKEYTDIPKVNCAPIEIQQVIINLLRNAAQAINAGNGVSNNPSFKPQITLRLKHNSEFVSLEIEDNGPGISEEVRQHVFEPFFTTKDAGEGTGLGLAVCYFIISEHHSGTIEVDSKPGQGTTFTVNLPVAHSAHSNTQAAPHSHLEQ